MSSSSQSEVLGAEGDSTLPRVNSARISPDRDNQNDPIKTESLEVGGIEAVEITAEKMKNQSLLRKLSPAINLQTAVADTEDLPLIW